MALSHSCEPNHIVNLKDTLRRLTATIGVSQSIERLSTTFTANGKREIRAYVFLIR